MTLVIGFFCIHLCIIGVTSRFDSVSRGIKNLDNCAFSINLKGRFFSDSVQNILAIEVSVN